jgi:Brp/Blh family beta-carotene 15,15'-monooxygenase
MIRFILLIIGCLLLICQQYIQAVPVQLQFAIFIVGIILLGVPHGAADLLVANQHAKDDKKQFSKLQFHCNYMGRLLLFAAIIWFFPLLGNVLFILFAAYHFGETDLHLFKIDTIAGKILVVSYGLVILSVILLHHFEELQPLSASLSSGNNYATIINWIDQHRQILFTCIGGFFLASSIFYFTTNATKTTIILKFLLQFAFILVILYNLPMVLGFTFYFIVWHSILSLQNIITYLRKDAFVTLISIVKQIGLYSLLAMGGVVICGFTGFMFVNNNTVLVYVFLGLAVLTAPHMQIMHDMYTAIRFQSSISRNV